MILNLCFPNIHLPRKHRLPSREWQRWFVIVPRFVHVEGGNRRRLILPGWHETRISQSQMRRVWREIGADA